MATQESCTQYNILKVARYIFRWSGAPAVADFYERAVLNGVIGIQRKPHAHSHGDHGHDHSHGIGDDHSHSHGHSHIREAHGGRALGEQAPGDRAHVGWGAAVAAPALVDPAPPAAGPGVMIYFTPLGACAGQLG